MYISEISEMVMNEFSGMSVMKQLAHLFETELVNQF
jgi:hypothetical protein